MRRFGSVVDYEDAHMLFLLGLDDAAPAGAPPPYMDPALAKGAMLKVARENAEGVFEAVQELPPEERRPALEEALSAFRPGGGDRVQRAALELVAKGNAAPVAMREAIARELAATTLAMMYESGSGGPPVDKQLGRVLDGLAGGAGLGFFGLLKKAWKKATDILPVLKIGNKVANSIAKIGCSPIARIAGPAVATAIPGVGPGAAVGVAVAQQGGCSQVKRAKAHAAARVAAPEKAPPSPPPPPTWEKLGTKAVARIKDPKRGVYKGGFMHCVDENISLIEAKMKKSGQPGKLPMDVKRDISVACQARYGIKKSPPKSKLGLWLFVLGLTGGGIALAAAKTKSAKKPASGQVAK